MRNLFEAPAHGCPLAAPLEALSLLFAIASGGLLLNAISHGIINLGKQVSCAAVKIVNLADRPDENT